MLIINGFQASQLRYMYSTQQSAPQTSAALWISFSYRKKKVNRYNRTDSSLTLGVTKHRIMWMLNVSLHMTIKYVNMILL